MLSEPLIRRLCDQQDHDRLLQGLVRNGLPLPLPLQVRLADSAVAVPALALRRLTELTYGPTPASRAIVSKLLARQEARGCYEGDPLVTACAVAAMGRVMRDQRGGTGLASTRDRAVAAMAGLQQGDGSFAATTDRTDADRLLTSVFVLYLLADEAGFRTAVRLADLLSFIEERIELADEATDELWQMTRVVLRPMPATVFTPATALVAA